MSKVRATVLITDLDNTLFDWFDVWYRSFSAMLEIVLRKSGVSRERLITEIKAIHRKHKTSEYAFLLEKLPSLQSKYGEANITIEFSDAIEAYRTERKTALTLYPTVHESLHKIKKAGTIVVGYTESLSYYSRYRVVNLGLDGIFDFLYTPPDHELPVERNPDKQFDLQFTSHENTPEGEIKPNPRVLTDIISGIGEEVRNCVYVGDSLHKDIAMAKNANVTDVWARYGVAHQKEQYELLREVTHWPDTEVELEKILEEKDVQITLEKEFCEIFDHVDFGRSRL